MYVSIDELFELIFISNFQIESNRMEKNRDVFADVHPLYYSSDDRNRAQRILGKLSLYLFILLNLSRNTESPTHKSSTISNLKEE